MIPYVSANKIDVLYKAAKFGFLVEGYNCLTKSTANLKISSAFG